MTLNNGIKYMIIGLNFFIRKAVIFIIDRIGCSTESSQMIYITNMVFICQLFNTGVLPMLCTANLVGQLPDGIVNAFGFKGPESDFSQNWFTNIGDTIVGSMKFNIYFPIGMEIMWFSMRFMKRFLDRMGATPECPTKSKTIQQYVNKFNGPVYFMHYKYSSIMNIIFLTMMFGPGMPILFPIAFASILVLYSLEIFMLYYVYQAPPAYDELLNNTVLSNLAWAPLFLLSFGYWTLTNPQLMDNGVMTPIASQGDAFMNGHMWYENINIFTTMANNGPAGALFVLFFAYFIYLVFRNPIWAIIKANHHRVTWCNVPKVFLDEAIPMDEQIGKYCDVLDADDRKFSIAEELNSRLYHL